MNRSNESEAPGSEVDLTVLNQTERHAPLLLSEGHTVKSIAVLSGRSLAAINERLRNARRKTGIGSSRELARLLRAQENCHEKTEVVRADTVEHRDISAMAKRSRMGRLMMFSSISSALIFAVVGISMQQDAPDSSATSRVAADPELYGLLPADQLDAGDLHERLVSEPRIAEWANASEAALRASYSRVPNLGKAAEIKAQCGATLCEVTSTLPTEKETPKGEIDALYRSLQAPELAARLKEAGLIHQGNLFTSTKTASPRPIFVSFWKRQSDRPAPDDQLHGVLRKEEKGSRARYTRLREEVRDPIWSARTEAGLRKLIDKLDVVQSEVKINCAATLCEVAILAPPGATNPQTEEFYVRLQSQALQSGLERLGLKGLEALFSGSTDEPSRTLYVTYLARTRT